MTIHNLRRKTLLAAGLGAMATLAILRVTHASAPADQYAEFARSSTEIADRQTKLLWLRTPASGFTFDQAKAYCLSRTPAGFRLPTAKELLTLVDEEPHEEYVATRVVTRYADQSAFGGFPDSLFWTSNQEDSTKAYVLSFQDGTLLTNLVGQSVSVRCVKKF